MASDDTVANAIYLAVKDDPSAVEVLKQKQKDVAMEIALGSDPMEVTSFTVNGQSAAGEVSRTREDLLTLLDLVIWCLENNSRISRRKILQFFG